MSSPVQRSIISFSFDWQCSFLLWWLITYLQFNIWIRNPERTCFLNVPYLFYCQKPKMPNKFCYKALPCKEKIISYIWSPGNTNQFSYWKKKKKTVSDTVRFQIRAVRLEFAVDKRDILFSQSTSYPGAESNVYEWPMFIEHLLMTKRIKWKTYQRLCCLEQDFKFHSIRGDMVVFLAQVPRRLVIQYERAF